MWFTLAIISALFSASAAILEKKSLKNDSPLNFSFILSIFNVLLSIPFIFYVNFDSISFIALAVLYFKTILGAASFLLIMHALKKMELSSSLPLLVLTPGLVAIGAYFTLNEKLTSIEIVGMIVLLAGTYVLQLKNNKKLLEPFRLVKQDKAYWYIIGALTIFTITSILDKALLSSYKLSPTAFLPFQHLFLSINFGIILMFSTRDKSELVGSFKQSWKLIVIVSVLTIAYRYSHILAIKAGSVALVLSIKRTSVFFATAIGGHYFKEKNLIRKTVATAIMIAGAAIIILY